MPTNKVIRKPYAKRNRHTLSFKDKTRTKQAHKNECDINQILMKHQKTGILTHINEHSPQYGDVPAQDFHEAMNIVKNAQDMFDELPSTVRQRFGGSPEAFLNYVQDPSNIDSFEDMGLTNDSAPENIKTPEKPLTRPKEPQDSIPATE